MSKTQLYMNEDNIDWEVRFADSEEKSIFSILRDAKVQRHEITMLDNALQKLAFTDYAVDDITELRVQVVLSVGSHVEKRSYDFLKTSSGWGVIREFRGHPLPVVITINELDTNSSGHLSMDIQGTGAGNDAATITVLANTKTAA